MPPHIRLLIRMFLYLMNAVEAAHDVSHQLIRVYLMTEALLWCVYKSYCVFTEVNKALEAGCSAVWPLNQTAEV
jgi:hypothetical protein